MPSLGKFLQIAHLINKITSKRESLMAKGCLELTFSNACSKIISELHTKVMYIVIKIGMVDLPGFGFAYIMKCHCNKTVHIARHSIAIAK